jgi:type IV pilus assembly protein PilW
MTSRSSFTRLRASRGVSLIELMVGVAIGLIGVVAIFQAVTVWTKHTQTTGSGSDAQTAGTLAFFNLERDLKQAGHGFGRAATALMGCNVLTTPVVPGAINLRPVEILLGAPVGAPDTINVFYGDSTFFVEEGDFLDSTDTTKRLPRRGGYRKGDIAVVAGDVGAPPVSTCMMIEVTDDTDPNGWIGHLPAFNYTSFYGGPPKNSRLNVAPPPAFVAGKIYNLGDRPQYDVWTIDNSHVLAKLDRLANPPVSVPIAEGVINMKAEYGYDVSGDGKIANAEWVTALPLGADWKRVLAIRVALLVRSRQFERNGDPGAAGNAAVTPSARNPTYFAVPGPAKPFLMTNVDGAADGFSDLDAVPNNWRYYRYRVYERVIPLRNMLWGTYG